MGAIKNLSAPVSIELDAESRAALRRAEFVAPKLFRTAERRALSTVKRALFSTIRKRGNKKYNVPQIANRTRETVALHGGSARDVFGKLRDKRYLFARASGDTWRAGWIDELAPYMAMLQDEDKHALGDREKFALNMLAKSRGESASALPASYNRVARPLIAPFAESMNREFPRWLIGAFDKLYRSVK